MNDTTVLSTVTWRGPVLREWVDYNGHLRDAYYLVIASLAVDRLMELIGLDEAGRKHTGHSIFTLESHINYLLEAKLDAMVVVRTQILGIDAKRMHIYNGIHLEASDALLAANEQMLLNVDMAGPRATPFAESVLPRLQALAVQHAQLPRPRYAGRAIALPGK